MKDFFTKLNATNGKNESGQPTTAMVRRNLSLPTMKQTILKKWEFLFSGWGEISQTATAPTETGTSGDPYQVATLNSLYWVTQNRSSWAAGKYFIQTADIDASSTNYWNLGAGFSPIGNTTTVFQGNYNGQYHSIDGLVINRYKFLKQNKQLLLNLEEQNIELKELKQLLEEENSY